MSTTTDSVAQHTPGPWQMQEHNSGASRVTAGPFEILLTNGTGAIADVWTANARLIAAAPDLLATLIDARHVLMEAQGAISHELGCPRSPGHVTGDCQCIKAVIEQQVEEAEAAIAKAEGRQ